MFCEVCGAHNLSLKPNASVEREDRPVKNVRCFANNVTVTKYLLHLECGTCGAKQVNLVYDQCVTITQFRDIQCPPGSSIIFTITRGSKPPRVWYLTVESPLVSEKLFFRQFAIEVPKKFVMQNHKLQGFFGGDEGFYMAYIQADKKELPTFKYSHLVNLGMEVTHTMLRVLDREIYADEELFTIANEGNEQMPELEAFEPELTPLVHYPGDYEAILNESELDPVLYDEFKHNMDQVVGFHNSKEIKFTGYSVGDNLVTPATAKFCDVKNAIDIEGLMNAVSKDGFLPLIGCLPKVGVYTSDNRPRAIFPMYLAYELVLRLNIKNNLHDNCQLLSPLEFCDFNYLRYSYDVKKCDKQMFPYYIKYALEKGLQHLLLPIVVRPGRKFYVCNQMPSGIYGTSAFVGCYVRALMKSMGVKCYMYQGDGIICASPLDDPRLRRNEDFVLNGFDYSGSEPKFVNQYKLRRPRGLGKLRGMDKYIVLYSAYRLMRADMSGFPVPPTVLLSSSAITDFCRSRNADAVDEVGRASSYLFITNQVRERLPIWDIGRVVGTAESFGLPTYLPKLIRCFKFS